MSDHAEKLAEALEYIMCKSDTSGRTFDQNIMALQLINDRARAARAAYRASAPAVQDGWRRSEPYKQGYQAAWKDAITFLHEKAKGMNDPHATAILNSAAFSLGANKGYGRPLTARVEIPPPSSGSET